MDAILRLVSDAHARMCPAVPLVGWDVALTTEGRCLLEANLNPDPSPSPSPNPDPRHMPPS